MKCENCGWDIGSAKPMRGEYCSGCGRPILSDKPKQLTPDDWLREYYPCPAAEATGSWLEAARHSLRKWRGLRPDVLKRYGLNASDYYLPTRQIGPIGGGPTVLTVGGDSCALYQRKEAADAECSDCPLGGCDDRLPHWAAWEKRADPEPMIAALATAVAKLEAEEGKKPGGLIVDDRRTGTFTAGDAEPGECIVIDEPPLRLIRADMRAEEEAALLMRWHTGPQSSVVCLDGAKPGFLYKAQSCEIDGRTPVKTTLALKDCEVGEMYYRGKDAASGLAAVLGFCWKRGDTNIIIGVNLSCDMSCCSEQATGWIPCKASDDGRTLILRDSHDTEGK